MFETGDKFKEGGYNIRRMPEHYFVRESGEAPPLDNRFPLWPFQEKKKKKKWVEWKCQDLKSLEMTVSTGSLQSKLTCQFSLASHLWCSPLKESGSGSMAGQAPDPGPALHC